MSLFGSLLSGVSGLNAQSTAMGIISDNIANVNTVGYKSTVARFSTLVTEPATNTSYTPGGVRVSPTALISKQGLIQASSSTTAAAISGRGFFVVTETATTGPGTEALFSRAGDFVPDDDGNLRNTSGFYLQGWATDRNGNLVDSQGNTINASNLNTNDISQLQTVNVQQTSIASDTQTVEIGANLNADQTALDVGAGAYTLGDVSTGTLAQPHNRTNVTVFDTLGVSRDVQLNFVAVTNATLGATTFNNNIWAVEVTSPDVTTATHPNGLIDSFYVTFNSDGSVADILNAAGVSRLTAGSTNASINLNAAGVPAGIDWSATAEGDPTPGNTRQTVALDFGTQNRTDGITQFGAGQDANGNFIYDTNFVNQDGAGTGDFTGVTIDEDGFVIAQFANGVQRPIFRVPVATFDAADQLEERTGNVFRQTQESGTFLLREAGRDGAGNLVPSALEASNVDLGEEFTTMIVTQRAYSAAATTITTADEMLEELIRIKR